MFSQIIKAFRAKRIAEELLTEFDQMLAHTAWMFEQASAVLARNVPSEQVRDTLYRRDKQVNELERSIRRKIIRHLSINPETELTGCLVFMSVSKDAERIGDYCKNVFEVGSWYTRELRSRYAEPLEQIRQQVQDMFQQTRQAFTHADADVARAVTRQAGVIAKKCDECIQNLLQQRDDLDTDEAVACSLLARHYKRVAAHLSNVCTAVISPVDMLDFHELPPPWQPEPTQTP
jgi:phosphate uptake regulator